MRHAILTLQLQLALPPRTTAVRLFFFLPSPIIHSFPHPFIHPFIRSFVHSFTPPAIFIKSYITCPLPPHLHFHAFRQSTVHPSNTPQPPPLQTAATAPGHNKGNKKGLGGKGKGKKEASVVSASLGAGGQENKDRCLSGLHAIGKILYANAKREWCGGVRVVGGWLGCA